MAALMLCSNSTIVSFGHNFLRISSRLTTLPGMLQQHGEDQEGLFRETNRFGPVLAQLTSAKVKFKRFETDNPFGGVDCHDPIPRRLRVYHLTHAKVKAEGSPELFSKRGDINNCACNAVSVSGHGLSRALIHGRRNLRRSV